VAKRKVTIDLKDRESLTVEVPLDDRGGEPLYSKLWHWYEKSGAFKAMKPITFKVLGYLLFRMNFERLDCWPSLKTIAAGAGLSKPSVISGIDELERLKIITKHSRADKNGTISNYYVILRPPRAVNEVDRGVNDIDRAGNEVDGGGLSRLTQGGKRGLHEIDTINNDHTTTTTNEIGCGSGGDFYYSILEGIEGLFVRITGRKNVRLDQVEKTLKKFDAKQIIECVKANCNDKTERWGAVDYWLGEYGKDRGRTGILVEDDIEQKRADMEAAELRAEREKGGGDDDWGAGAPYGLKVRIAKEHIEDAKKKDNTELAEVWENRLAGLLGEQGPFDSAQGQP
jgi:DNA-binding Lrp family transcriptional regulator